MYSTNQSQISSSSKTEHSDISSLQMIYFTDSTNQPSMSFNNMFNMCLLARKHHLWGQSFSQMHHSVSIFRKTAKSQFPDLLSLKKKHLKLRKNPRFTFTCFSGLCRRRGGLLSQLLRRLTFPPRSAPGPAAGRLFSGCQSDSLQGDNLKWLSGNFLSFPCSNNEDERL